MVRFFLMSSKLFFEAANAAIPPPAKHTLEVEANSNTISAFPAFSHSDKISKISSCLSSYK